MRIALCNEVVRDLSIPDQARLAAGLGYHGLEIAPFTLGEEPHRLPMERRREVRSMVEDAGLRITGLHWLLVTPDGLSITARDPAVIERTVGVMRALVELCHDLGGSYLVHGSPKQRAVVPGDTVGTASARAADAFAQVAPAAEQAGVVYLIEPLARSETEVINTVDEAVAIVDAVASPALLTMIDACAAAQSEDDPVPALIERWVPTRRIGHIHLNDRNRKAPGQGRIRFRPILEALSRTRYAGWCGVEPFVYEPDGPTSAARAVGYLQGLLED
ncbi:MAG: sugar phosphate isomerase/epimerase family protein [Geminicoccaceae bacterium]|nr:sugar phosphate isomerase/epimerase family protein [Geminicoccaceae bacterium]